MYYSGSEGGVGGEVKGSTVSIGGFFVVFSSVDFFPFLEGLGLMMMGLGSFCSGFVFVLLLLFFSLENDLFVSAAVVFLVCLLFFLCRKYAVERCMF